MLEGPYALCDRGMTVKHKLHERMGLRVCQIHIRQFPQRRDERIVLPRCAHGIGIGLPLVISRDHVAEGGRQKPEQRQPDRQQGQRE